MNHKILRIGFAGTDARTLLSALVLSTATSAHSEQRFQGVVIRGTSAMPAFARHPALDWPVDFIPTADNSVSAYAQAISQTLKQGVLDYVFPLPEGLLFGGLVDQLTADGLGERVIGLSSTGAFLEADKIRCKEFCKQAGIPVADAWKAVDAKDYGQVLETCMQYLHQFGGVVLKYPYSAGGKGARVILNAWEIREVYDQLLADYKKDYKKVFGRKGRWPLLIESRMSGVEISFTIFVDEAGHFQVLPTAMDYPERFSGPAGKGNPITGGMGSISPHPFESEELFSLVRQSIAQPLVSKLKEQGLLRPCVLYPGCFVSFSRTAEGIKPISIRVCEINVRPGEPEFQSVARRLRNLGQLIEAMFKGTLDQVAPEVRTDQLALCVALVTGPGGPDGQKGYPWSVTKFEPLEIDFEYFKKKKIQIIPSAMGYQDGKGFVSDGTRVAFLNVNGTLKPGQTRGELGEKLRQRILTAYRQGRVRVIPREDPQGNRLALRDDIGLQYSQAEAIASL